MNRYLPVLLGFVLLFGLAVCRVDAAAEICPALIDSPLQRVGPGVYEYRLSAMSERGVTGIIRIQTPKGWYNALFQSVKLHQKPAETINDDQVHLLMLNAFVSDPQYVRLPDDTPVSYAYVSQARTSGETVFGWDKSGDMPCEPIPQPQSTAPPQAVAAATPPANAIVQARAIDSPFTSTCEKPFSPLKPIVTAPMQYPPIFENWYTALPTGTTIVAVAADNKGSILDAWVWESSGTPSLDAAAVSEARGSTYAPARAFCRSVSDYYLFRVNWRG